MNTPLKDSQKIPFKIQEYDEKGVATPPLPGDTCVVTSSDPTIGTVAQDATSTDSNCVATGFFVGGSNAGTVTFTSVITRGPDATVAAPPDAVDIFDVTAGEPRTQGILLGAPVDQ